MASMVMTSMSSGRKKMVGFDMPSIIVDSAPAGGDGGLDDDSDDDDDELGNKATSKLLEKAFTYTRKSRFKSLVGDALQLTQQNRRASQDFFSGVLEKKTRRKSVMKGVIERKIPKICQLFKTKNERNDQLVISPKEVLHPKPLACLSPRNAPVPKLPPINNKSRGQATTNSFLSPVQEDDLKPVIDEETPYIRFKRMARVVLLLIQVCNVCKDIVTQGVKKEPWFALLDNLVATSTIKQKRKGPRAFVTFVPNEKRELVQLTFDVSEFKKDRKSEFILTDEVRETLAFLPNSRPEEQIPQVIRCMKALFEDFNNYPLSVQKQICQKAFYDKYRYNRVIVKKGQNPDGIYFVMSGSLIEKHEAGRQPKEIQTGTVFGENDLITGATRRHTVMTRTETELLYLHRQDYRAIFNMSEDSNDPKNLEICKQHIVFQHFPMFRLETNPGTWSVLKYKYGRLIAKDSTDVDWIYVIKSGEARVFKYLEPGHIDIQARRKKVQAMINSQSTFYKKKKILNFVEERDYIKSSYSPRKYHPATRPIMSAPAGQSRDHFLVSSAAARRDVATCIPGKRQNRHHSVTSSLGGAPPSSVRSKRSNSNSKDGKKSRHTSLGSYSSTGGSGGGGGGGGGGKSSSSRNESGDGVKLPALILPDEEEGDEADDNNNIDKDTEAVDHNNRDSREHTGGNSHSNDLVVTETIHDLKATNGGPLPQQQKKSSTSPNNKTHTGDHNASSSQNKSALFPTRAGRARSGSFLHTPLLPGATTRSSLSNRSLQASQQSQSMQVGNHTLPAFVQVETLHPGQVFGLRACLDPEERGPMVSLVSGECEILQINKKFFMKHCDDAIYSLIRLKAKPWPSQEDLIDRLDVNMQWEEYKHKTMVEFLQQNRRLER